MHSWLELLLPRARCLRWETNATLDCEHQHLPGTTHTCLFLVAAAVVAEPEEPDWQYPEDPEDPTAVESEDEADPGPPLATDEEGAPAEPEAAQEAEAEGGEGAAALPKVGSQAATACVQHGNYELIGTSGVVRTCHSGPGPCTHAVPSIAHASPILCPQVPQPIDYSKCYLSYMAATAGQEFMTTTELTRPAPPPEDDPEAKVRPVGNIVKSLIRAKHLMAQLKSSWPPPNILWPSTSLTARTKHFMAQLESLMDRTKHIHKHSGRSYRPCTVWASAL